jgi:hypothetical protein
MKNAKVLIEMYLHAGFRLETAHELARQTINNSKNNLKM